MLPPEAVRIVKHHLENTSIFLKLFCIGTCLAAAPGRDKSRSVKVQYALRLAAQETNCRSTGTRNPLARRFVSFARPTTASSSMGIASLMRFLRAAAVCEHVQ